MSTQARRTFVFLIIVSIFLVGVIIRPFAEALFFAAVLAAALYPIHRRLKRLLKNRPNSSASILCVAVVFALVAPIGGIAAFAVNESISGGRFIAKTVQSEGMAGLLDQLPAPMRKAADELLRRFPLEEQDIDTALQQQASKQSGRAAAAVTGVLTATGSFVFQAIMMTIAFFFLLVDGARLVRWLEHVSPLEEGQMTELLIEFRKVTSSVLISSLATAGVQALAALLGYLIASVPHPLFFATVTFFVSFVPAVGAGGTVLVAAVLLLAMGKTWMALFLAIWGVVAVGMVDNVIKPLLVKRGMHMHGAIVFFSLLGGLTVFGTVGLLAGPLIVSFFLALVRIYQRDYGRDPEFADVTGRPVALAGTGLVLRRDSRGSEPAPATAAPAPGGPAPLPNDAAGKIVI
jgi:predicted PurR-regulated permease PerM